MNATFWKKTGRGDTASAARLARLWQLRNEPESSAPRDALELAEVLGARHETPPPLLALAWRTVETIFETLGWAMPSSPELARCRSAALSARQTAWATIERTLSELPPDSEAVLVLGSLGLSTGALGVPDILPSQGALLVRMNGGGPSDASATGVPTTTGVRWASPGRLTRMMEGACEPYDLGGHTVLMPSPALVAALTARGCTGGNVLDRLLFAVAWHRVSGESEDLRSLETTAVAGSRRLLDAAAWSLGLGPRPGLVTRLQLALRP